MMLVTRRYRFSASHRLHAAQLSEAENRALYGKCNNPYGHGHNYVLEVSAVGLVDPRSGRAVDVKALDRLVRSQVLEAFDHRNLNIEVPEFAFAVPTTENLGLAIRRRLALHWRTFFGEQGPKLSAIRIEETRRNRFEIIEEA